MKESLRQGRREFPSLDCHPLSALRSFLWLALCPLISSTDDRHSFPFTLRLPSIMFELAQGCIMIASWVK